MTASSSIDRMGPWTDEGTGSRQAGSVVPASRANRPDRDRSNSAALAAARRLLLSSSMLRTILIAVVLSLTAVACGDGGAVTLTSESGGCNGSGVESVFAFALILVPLFRGMGQVDEEDAQ
jgi:hypothetical protein